MSEVASPDRRGEAASRISNRIVAIVKDRLGRGPTRARTFIRDNLVVCLLEDSLTRPERSLVAGGKGDWVQQLRTQLQDTMEADLRAAVEETLGRRVVAFMSANHTDPDYMTEVFVLDADAEEAVEGARLAAVEG